MADSESVLPRPSRLPVLAAAPVTVRHIKRGSAAGAITVLGASFAPQPRKGANGPRGYSSGSYESALNDDGKGTLALPNIVGDDGVLHRRRFACLTDADYQPGDEWIEVWQDGRDKPLFVGTPLDWEKRRAHVTLELVDAAWMLNQQRETAAAFWAHAPRDVFEHYTTAWIPIIADDFDQGANANWTTVHATNQAGSVRLEPPTADTAAELKAASSVPGVAIGSQRAWRLEMTHNRFLAATGLINLLLTSETAAARFEFQVTTTTIDVYYFNAPGGTDYHTVVSAPPLRQNGGSLAIEGRDRWVFFYVDGQLQVSIELDITSSDIYRPWVQARNGATVGTWLEVSSLLLRRADPYLMRGADKGDHRIPGLLPAGGLRGTYYDEADLRVHGDTSAKLYRRALAPTRQPYARRQDPTINFSAAGWQPAGPADNKYFSVRWTGAIYLDLAAADVTLNVVGFGGARLSIGKTLYGQHVAAHWGTGGSFSITTGSMRAHLGMVSGWYPIRLEVMQGSTSNDVILSRSVGGAAYEAVPTTALSPFGIYEAQVRYDSHAEQLKAIALAYGLQYRCEPRSLESGGFPGEVVPRIRVGRDTDKILTPDESTDVGVQGSASDVVTTMLADASGLGGDQAGGAQLTSEAIHYAGAQPGRHMALASAYESLADITDPMLLQTRLASMLGLRLTPWEEIAAKPRGHRELRDTFPMTGQIAAFAWEPGDGLRIEDDAIDLKDLTPRQIIAPSWPFRPDGLGVPSVRFRQRPRSQQDALRALVRATLLPQRNYQGQLATVSGNIASQPASTTVTDTLSRVSLPPDLAAVLRADLVVQSKSDTSTVTVNVNGAATGLTFTVPGRYDLRPYIARDATNPRMYAHLSGGTGTTTFALELLVRV